MVLEVFLNREIPVYYDDILKRIGEFGIYQKRLFAFMCLQPITTGLLLLLSTFTFATPDHRCAIPGYNNDTYSPQNDYHKYLINQTIPQSSSCLLRNETTDIYGNVTSVEYKCDVWVYDTSTFTSTFVTEFNLVCDNAVEKNTAVMVLFPGLLIGYTVGGNIADFFGRKPVMVVCNYVFVLSTYLMVWSPNYTFLLVFRFFLGISLAGQGLTIFNIGLEIVGPSKRRYTGLLSNFSWCLGMFLMSLFGYLIRSWRYLQLSVSIVSTYLLLFVFVVPESPRWLLTRGYKKKAKVIIERVAKVNQVEIDELDLDITVQDKVKKIKVWKLLTSCKLITRTLTVYFCWFASSITYFGIMLNLESLVGDIYFNMFLAACLEAVCYMVVILLIERLGRKNMLGLSLLIAGVSLTSVIFVFMFAPKDMKWLTTLFTFVGQFGVTCAFCILWMWTGELFPTELRTFGIGSGSASARIGAIVAPYFGLIKENISGIFKESAPYVIYTVFCVAALVMLFIILPDTSKKPLTETIDDWEKGSPDDPLKEEDFK